MNDIKFVSNLMLYMYFRKSTIIISAKIFYTTQYSAALHKWGEVGLAA